MGSNFIPLYNLTTTTNSGVSSPPPVVSLDKLLPSTHSPSREKPSPYSSAAGGNISRVQDSQSVQVHTEQSTKKPVSGRFVSHHPPVVSLDKLLPSTRSQSREKPSPYSSMSRNVSRLQDSRSVQVHTEESTTKPVSGRFISHHVKERLSATLLTANSLQSGTQCVLRFNER